MQAVISNGIRLDNGLIAHYKLNGDANDSVGSNNAAWYIATNEYYTFNNTGTDYVTSNRTATVIAVSPTTGRLGDANGAFAFTAGQTTQITVGAMSARYTQTGNSMDSGALFSNCEFDDVRIYNRAITPNEVNALYNSARGTEADISESNQLSSTSSSPVISSSSSIPLISASATSNSISCIMTIPQIAGASI